MRDELLCIWSAIAPLRRVHRQTETKMKPIQGAFLPGVTSLCQIQVPTAKLPARNVHVAAPVLHQKGMPNARLDVLSPLSLSFSRFYLSLVCIQYLLRIRRDGSFKTPPNKLLSSLISATKCLPIER